MPDLTLQVEFLSMNSSNAVIEPSSPRANSSRKGSQKTPIKCMLRGFPGGPVVKTLPCNVGGVDSIPGWAAKVPKCLVVKKSKHKTEAIL